MTDADRTAEAEAVIAAMDPGDASRTLRALLAAQALHTLVMDEVRCLDAYRHADAAGHLRADHGLVNAVNLLDGSALLQTLLIEVREVLGAIVDHPDDLDIALEHEVMEPEAVEFAIGLLRTGPLGQVALTGCSGGDFPPPERVHPERVTGTDGKSYPGSTAYNEAQRANIVALRREHPDWSARKIAREVGCSQNTVIAVDQVLAGVAP